MECQAPGAPPPLDAVDLYHRAEDMKYEMVTARYLKERIVHRSTQDQHPCPISGADPGHAISNAKNCLHQRHMATAVSVDDCIVPSPVDGSAALC